MAKKREIKLPMYSTRADFTPGTINPEKRTVELIWATGKKGMRRTWDGNYYEELSMKPEHVKMGRLESGNAPLLNAHSAWDNASVIGVVESARLENGKGIAVVRFADTPDVADIWRKVETGILKNVSVGYSVNKYERQNPLDPNKRDEIPHLLATDWEPKEISIVPIGFDDSATIRSDEGSLSSCLVIDEISSNENEIRETEKMLETKETVVNPVISDVDKKRIADEAVKTERTRQDEIRAIAKKLDLGDEFATRMISEGVELEQVRAQAIDAKATAQVERKTSRVEAGAQDEVETRRDGIENALLHRSDRKIAIDEKGRIFAGMSLLRMGEELIGRSARGLSKSELVKRTMSTSDFPLILANVAGKTLRNAYGVAPKSFMPFVTIGTLPDYKPMKRVQLGDAPNLAAQSEDGELTYGSMGESAESIQLVKYAKGVKFTEEMLINDDLGAFSRAIQLFGNASARLESQLVYAVLSANAAMSDGVALFHADHGNLPSASAINDAGLTAAKKLMREQTTLDGSDYLNLEPAFLVVGTAKEVEALKIMNAAMVPAQTSNVNIFANSMQVIVDPRISGNKWYLIANPSQIDTIELAYLQGMSGPEVTSEIDFDTSGLKIKCKHVAGVKAIDHRGMVYNSGA